FNASWTHQISERISLCIGGGYSLSSFQSTPTGTERSFSATAGASYLLSDTVSTVARYSFFNRSSNFAGRTFADNIFLLSLTKRF
ncbi:MAG: outer membrane beta-barrel protein, partial [Acetobacteraceae bacterium]